MFSLFKYTRKRDWLFLAITVGLIVLQVWLELKLPEYTAKLTQIVQIGEQGGLTDMGEVWKNGGLMLACALGSLLASVICTFIVSKIASAFSMTLRDKIYSKISSFSSAEINKFSTASLITRTTNDIMQMQNFMAMGIQLLFKAPIMAIWAICKISTANVSWTIAIIISVAVIIVCIAILVGICFPKFRKIQKLTDEINNITRESVSGVRVVRAFNAEEYQEGKFEKTNDKITKNHLFTSRAMGVMMPMLTLVMNGVILAIYWIGAILVNNVANNGDMLAVMTERIELIGNMTAFTQYSLQIIMAFMMLIMIFVILPRTIVSSRRINEVLNTQSSIVGATTEVKTDKVGEIEFKNVSFAYDKGLDKNAISNVSFKVNRGQTLAIVGATGSAKSTLINLIPRFYDVTQGEVLVDGVNVKDYPENQLRDKIAVATQKAVLFKGTIKDNIAYGSEGIDEDKLNKVIEISQSQFVNQLEDGINSIVAQGGTNFSGGQKQRLSIARALYKDAEIMIFDDTFSALDYKTDMLVRKSIKENFSDKTIIIVAQRIGTIKDVDKILVLDEGEIVGEGKHEDLLNSCPLYKEIALSQLAEEEL